MWQREGLLMKHVVKERATYETHVAKERVTYETCGKGKGYL